MLFLLKMSLHLIHALYSLSDAIKFNFIGQIKFQDIKEKDNNGKDENDECDKACASFIYVINLFFFF